jgi:hypothetical protein
MTRMPRKIMAPQSVNLARPHSQINKVVRDHKTGTDYVSVTIAHP